MTLSYKLQREPSSVANDLKIKASLFLSYSQVPIVSICVIVSMSYCTSFQESGVPTTETTGCAGSDSLSSKQ